MEETHIRTTIRNSVIALTLIVALTGKASAQDLRTALQDLQSISPNILAAKESMLQEQQLLEATKKRLYPQVSVNFQAAHTNKYDSTVRRIGRNSGVGKTVYSGEISAKQELFSGYSDMARIEEAEAKVRRAAALHDGTIQSELENGIVAYLTFVQESMIFASLEESLNLTIETHDLILKSADSGSETSKKLTLAKKNIDDAKARLASQGRRLARSAGNYVRYFGVEPNITSMRITQIPELNMPASLDELLEIVETNPGVIAGFMRAQSMHSRAKLAESARYPTLDLTLSHEQNNDKFAANTTISGIELNSTIETRLELNLRWNLSNALLNQNAEQSAQARVRAEQAKAHSLMQRTKGRAVQAWEDYLYLADELSSLEAMLDKENELLALEEKNMESGGGTNLAVLKQRNRRERTIQRHIRADVGLEIAKVKILALANNLTTEL